MKTKIIIIISTVILSLNTYGNDTIKIEKCLPLNNAISLVKHSYSSTTRQNAIDDLHKYAESNYVEAMNALGMVYYKGLHSGKDYDRSLFWFEKASKMGYAKADYNLAMMYRRGVGVEQDFKKAFYYLQRAAQSGNAQAMYGVGYFLYKGFGVKQDYGKAIEYFEKAAGKNHGFAMYMLGLCYRNGYGVKQDITQGNMWLTKAAAKKIKSSQAELQADSPERPLKSLRLRSVSAGDKSDLAQFKEVKHSLKRSTDIEGEYVGNLITYDWSGQHVIDEKPLTVTIGQSAEKITIKWQEEGATYLQAEGVLTDSALVFKNAGYLKKYYHNRSEEPMIWHLTKAELKIVAENDGIQLSGNLQTYSPESKEPNRPMYLVLRTQQVATDISVESVIMENTPVIYPNPFNNILHISFHLANSENCTVHIHAIDGSVVYQQQLGMLNSGKHRYQIDLNIPKGHYVASIIYGSRKYSSVIIKE